MQDFKAQFAKYGLIDILSDEGPSYYTSNFTKLTEEPNLVSVECGDSYGSNSMYNLTVPNDDTPNHTIIRKNEGLYSKELFPYTLTETNKYDNLKFLNNKSEVYWRSPDTSNHSYQFFIPNPYVLIAQKGNKYGLLTIDYTNIFSENLINQADTLIEQQVYLRQKTITHNAIPVSSKLIMPVKMDSIINDETNELTYFYQKGKVGIYPYHKKVRYQSIKQVSNNFYRIRIGKKEGWLDIKTMKEYF